MRQLLLCPETQLFGRSCSKNSRTLGNALMTPEVAEEPPQKAPYPGGGKPSKGILQASFASRCIRIQQGSVNSSLPPIVQVSGLFIRPKSQGLL